MKKITIVVIISISVVFGFFVGYYLYKINKISDDSLNLAENLVMKNTMQNEVDTVKVKAANSYVDKVSPNCNLIIKKYYKQCNHLIETSEKIVDNSLVNLSKEEFAKKYNGWDVKEFNPKEIVIYKEIDDFCNEHYILKEKDGYIAIYKLDKENSEKIEKTTNIIVKYLPQTDIEELKKGIKIFSKEELNKVIQDYE